MVHLFLLEQIEARRRFDGDPTVEIAHVDTLSVDAFDEFVADLVIVDAPWGVNWGFEAGNVEARQREGEFGFGLPERSDATWLFISLALEKLRPADLGGGRAAALVSPAALSSGRRTAAVRRRIVEAGLLESVTRLPEGLAPNTAIPLYLLTFSNKTADVGRGKAMIADLRTQFTTEGGRRHVPTGALRELESGLRTRKPGPRNRTVATRQFIRRDAKLSRRTTDGHLISWGISAYNDSTIDGPFLESRYGPDSGVSLVEGVRETVDLDPSRILGDDSGELVKDMEAKGWPCRRLSSLIAREPDAVTADSRPGQLFVPTTRGGRAVVEPADVKTGGRTLRIQLEGDAVYPPFLAAWLNSEQGTASRQHAIATGASGHHIRIVRSDARSLMRWADELLVPVPEISTQLALASADEQLGSFQAELNAQRASIWAAPESADEVVARVSSVFDDSLTAWLDQLPFPIASALWTAEIAASWGDRQRAYLHAWEAIVTFHATVLLSACRSDPTSSREIETVIRQSLHEQHLGIERASFGTWVVIAEKTSKELRRALESGDADDLARIRRAFGDLSHSGIERLISKDVVRKFSELNGKRNRWLGHTGYTSEEEWRAQVESLVADLRELRGMLGSVWAQLVLVRAGSGKLVGEVILQTAEVAVGTRTPFASMDFRVGEMMRDGELYLVRDGSQSPLRVGQFVQLRSAPSGAQFTTYFYNRTEGSRVRMVSYQYGPDGELENDVESFRTEFGQLAGT